MSFFASVADKIGAFFKTLGAKVQQFMAGPGGAIIKQAAANFVQVLGTEAAQELMLMAQRQVGGKRIVNSDDWARISSSLQSQAVQIGVQAAPAVIESLADYAIGQAVAANGGSATVPAGLSVASSGS